MVPRDLHIGPPPLRSGGDIPGMGRARFLKHDGTAMVWTRHGMDGQEGGYGRAERRGRLDGPAGWTGRSRRNARSMTGGRKRGVRERGWLDIGEESAGYRGTGSTGYRGTELTEYGRTVPAGKRASGNLAMVPACHHRPAKTTPPRGSRPFHSIPFHFISFRPAKGRPPGFPSTGRRSSGASGNGSSWCRSSWVSLQLGVIPACHDSSLARFQLGTIPERIHYGGAMVRVWRRGGVTGTARAITAERSGAVAWVWRWGDKSVRRGIKVKATRGGSSPRQKRRSERAPASERSRTRVWRWGGGMVCVQALSRGALCKTGAIPDIRQIYNKMDPRECRRI